MNVYGIPQSSVGDRKRKVKFSQKVVALFPVIALILPAQLALNRTWQSLVYVGIAIFVSIGVLLPVRVPLKSYKTVPLMLLLSLIAMSCISAALNDWTRPILVYSAHGLAYFAALRIVVFVKDPTVVVKSIVLGTSVVSLAIIVACLATNSPSIYRYQGIFNNPNSMGWFSASLLSLYLGVLVYSRTQWSKLQTALIGGVLVLCSLLLFASNSRAGLAAVCAPIGSFGLVFAHSFLMKSKLRRKRIVTGLMALTIITVIAFYFGLLDRVVEKFQETSSSGDISQGRFDIWESAISTITWFGNGVGANRHSHSTYISQLTKYGIVPTVLFFSFYSMLWLVGYINTIKGNYLSAPILLSVTSAFLVHTLFETGTATPGVWLSILMFCCLTEEIRQSGRNSFQRLQPNTYPPNAGSYR